MKTDFMSNFFPIAPTNTESERALFPEEEHLRVRLRAQRARRGLPPGLPLLPDHGEGVPQDPLRHGA